MNYDQQRKIVLWMNAAQQRNQGPFRVPSERNNMLPAAMTPATGAPDITDAYDTFTKLYGAFSAISEVLQPGNANLGQGSARMHALYATAMDQANKAFLAYQDQLQRQSKLTGMDPAMIQAGLQPRSQSSVVAAKMMQQLGDLHGNLQNIVDLIASGNAQPQDLLQRVRELTTRFQLALSSEELGSPEFADLHRTAQNAVEMITDLQRKLADDTIQGAVLLGQTSALPMLSQFQPLLQSVTSGNPDERLQRMLTMLDQMERVRATNVPDWTVDSSGKTVRQAFIDTYAELQAFKHHLDDALFQIQVFQQQTVGQPQAVGPLQQIEQLIKRACDERDRLQQEIENLKPGDDPYYLKRQLEGTIRGKENLETRWQQAQLEIGQQLQAVGTLLPERKQAEELKTKLATAVAQLKANLSRQERNKAELGRRVQLYLERGRKLTPAQQSALQRKVEQIYQLPATASDEEIQSKLADAMEFALRTQIAYGTPYLLPDEVKKAQADVEQRIAAIDAQFQAMTPEQRSQRYYELSKNPPVNTSSDLITGHLNDVIEMLERTMTRAQVPSITPPLYNLQRQEDIAQAELERRNRPQISQQSIAELQALFDARKELTAPQLLDLAMSQPASQLWSNPPSGVPRELHMLRVIEALNQVLEQQGQEFDRGQGLDVGIGMGQRQGYGGDLGRLEDAIKRIADDGQRKEALELAAKYAEANIASIVRVFKRMLVNRYQNTLAGLAVAGGNNPLEELQRRGVEPITSISQTLQQTQIMDYTEMVRRNLLNVVLESFDRAQSQTMFAGRGTNYAGAQALQAKLANDAMRELNQRLEQMGLPPIDSSQQGRIQAFYQQYAQIAYYQHHVDPLAYMLLGTLGDSGENEEGGISPLGITTQTINPQQRQLRRVEGQAEGYRGYIADPSKAVETYVDRQGRMQVRVAAFAPFHDEGQRAAYKPDDVRDFNEAIGLLNRMSEQEVARIFERQANGELMVVDNERVTRGYDTIRDTGGIYKEGRSSLSLENHLRQLQAIETAMLTLAEHPDKLYNMPSDVRRTVLETITNVIGDVSQGRSALQKRPGDMTDLVDNLLPPWARQLQSHLTGNANSTEQMLDQLEHHLRGRDGGQGHWPSVPDLDDVFVQRTAQAIQRLNLNMVGRNNAMGVTPHGGQYALTMAQLALYAGPEILQRNGRPAALSTIEFMQGEMRHRIPDEQDMERFGEDLAGYLFDPSKTFDAVRENRYAGYNAVTYEQQEFVKYRAPLESLLRRMEERFTGLVNLNDSFAVEGLTPGVKHQLDLEMRRTNETYSTQYFRWFDQHLDDAALGYAGTMHIAGSGNDYGADAKTVEQRRENGMKAFDQMIRNLEQAMTPEQMSRLFNHLAEMGRKARREGAFSVPDVADALDMMGRQDVIADRMGHYVTPEKWQTMTPIEKERALMEMVQPSRAGAKPSNLVIPGVEQVGLNQIYPFAHMTANLMRDGAMSGLRAIGGGFMAGLRTMKKAFEDRNQRGNLMNQLPEPVQMLVNMNDGLNFWQSNQGQIRGRMRFLNQQLNRQGLTAAQRAPMEQEYAYLATLAEGRAYNNNDVNRVRKFSEFNYAPLLTDSNGMIVGNRVNPFGGGAANNLVRPQNQQEFKQFLADIRALTVGPGASEDTANAIIHGESTMPHLGLDRNQAEMAALILRFGGLKDEEKGMFLDSLSDQLEFGKLRRDSDIPGLFDAFATWPDSGNLRFSDAQVAERYDEMREQLQASSYLDWQGQRHDGGGLDLENLPVYTGRVDIPQEERRLLQLPRQATTELAKAAVEGGTPPNFSEGMDASQLSRSIYGIMSFGDLTREQKLQIAKINQFLYQQGYAGRGIEGDPLGPATYADRANERVAPGWRNMLTGPEGTSPLRFLVIAAEKGKLPTSYQQAVQWAKAQGIPIHNLSDPKVLAMWQQILANPDDFNPGAKGFVHVGREMQQTLTDYEYQMRLLNKTATGEAPEMQTLAPRRQRRAGAHMAPRGPPASARVLQITSDTEATGAEYVEQCAACGRILNGPHAGESLDEVGNGTEATPWSHSISCSHCRNDQESLQAKEANGEELGETEKAFVRRRQMLLESRGENDTTRFYREKYPWLTGGNAFSGGEQRFGFLKNIARLFFGNGLLATTLPTRQPLTPYDFFRYGSKLQPTNEGQPIGGSGLQQFREAMYLGKFLERARAHGKTLGSDTAEQAFYRRISWGDHQGFNSLARYQRELMAGGRGNLSEEDEQRLRFLAKHYDTLARGGRKKTGYSEATAERMLLERDAIEHFLGYGGKTDAKRGYQGKAYPELTEQIDASITKDQRFSPGWMKLLRSLSPYAIVLASMFGPSGIHEYDESGIKPWQRETRRGDRPLYIDDLHDMAQMPKDEWFDLLDMLGIRNETVKTVEAMGYDIEELLQGSGAHEISSAGKRSLPREVPARAELFPDTRDWLSTFISARSHAIDDANLLHGDDPGFPYGDVNPGAAPVPPVHLLRFLTAARRLQQQSGQILLPEHAASLQMSQPASDFDDFLNRVNIQKAADREAIGYAPQQNDTSIAAMANAERAPAWLDQLPKGTPVTADEMYAGLRADDGIRLALRYLAKPGLNQEQRDRGLLTLRRHLAYIEQLGQKDPGYLEPEHIKQAQAYLDDPQARAELAFRDLTRRFGGNPDLYQATQGVSFDLSRHIRGARRNNPNSTADTQWNDFWQSYDQRAWPAGAAQSGIYPFEPDADDLAFAATLGSGVHDVMGHAAVVPSYDPFDPTSNFGNFLRVPTNADPKLTGVEREYAHLSYLRSLALYNGAPIDGDVVQRMQAIEQHMGWPEFDDTKISLSQRQQYRRKKLREAGLVMGVAPAGTIPSGADLGPYIPIVGKLGDHPEVEKQIRDMLAIARFEPENDHLFAQARALAQSIGLDIMGGRLIEQGMPTAPSATALRQTRPVTRPVTPPAAANLSMDARLNAAESGIYAIQNGLTQMAATTPAGHEGQLALQSLIGSGDDQAVIDAIVGASKANANDPLVAQVKAQLAQYRQGNTNALASSVHFDDVQWSQLFTTLARNRSGFNPAASSPVAAFVQPGLNALNHRDLFERLPSLYTGMLAGMKPQAISSLLSMLQQGAPLDDIVQHPLVQHLQSKTGSMDLAIDFLQRVAAISGINHPDISGPKAEIPLPPVPPPAPSRGRGAQQALQPIAGADIGFESKYGFGLDMLRGFVGTDPYAQRIIDSVLGPDPAHLTAIEAPAGTGKTRLSAALLAGMVAQDPTARILTVAPTINAKGALSSQLDDLAQQLGDVQFAGALQTHIANETYGSLPRKFFANSQEPMAGTYWNKQGFGNVPTIIPEDEMTTFMREAVLPLITGVKPEDMGSTNQFGNIAKDRKLEDIYKVVQQQINNPEAGQRAILRGEAEFNKNAAVIKDAGRTNLGGSKIGADTDLWLGAFVKAMQGMRLTDQGLTANATDGRVSFAYDQFAAARAVTSDDPEMQKIVQEIIHNAGFSHVVLDEAQQGTSSNHALAAAIMQNAGQNVVVGDSGQGRGEGMTGHAMMKSLRQYWGNLTNTVQGGVKSFQRVFQRRLGWEQFANIMGNPQVADENGDYLEQYHPGMKPVSDIQSGDYPREYKALQPYEMAEKMIRMALDKAGYTMEMAQKITREGSLTGDGIEGVSKQVGMTMMNHAGLGMLQRVMEDMGVEGVFGHESLSGKQPGSAEYEGAMERNSRKINFGTALSAGGWEAQHIIAGATNARFEKPETSEEKRISEQVNNLIALTRSKEGGTLSIFDTMTRTNSVDHLGLGHGVGRDPNEDYGYAMRGNQVYRLRRDPQGQVTEEAMDHTPDGLRLAPVNQPGTLGERTRVRIMGNVANYGIGALTQATGFSSRNDLNPANMADLFANHIPHDIVAALRDLTPEQQDDIIAKATGLAQDQVGGMLTNGLTNMPGHRGEMSQALQSFGVDAGHLDLYGDDEIRRTIADNLDSARTAMRDMMNAGRQYKDSEPQSLLAKVLTQYKQSTGKEMPREHQQVLMALTEPALQEALDKAATGASFSPTAAQFAGNLTNFVKTFEWMSSMVASVVNPQFTQAFQAAVGISPGAGGVGTASARADAVRNNIRNQNWSSGGGGSSGGGAPPGMPFMPGDQGGEEQPKETVIDATKTANASAAPSTAPRPSLTQAALNIGRTLGRTAFDMSFAGSAMLQEVQQQIAANQEFYVAANIANQYGGGFGGNYNAVTRNPLIQSLQQSIPGFSLAQAMQAYSAYSALFGGGATAGNLTTAAGISKATGTPLEQLLTQAASASAGGLSAPGSTFAGSTQSLLQSVYGYAGPMGTSTALDTIAQMGFGTSDQKLAFLGAGSQAFGGSPATYGNLGQLYNNLSQATYAPSMAQQTALAFLYKPQALGQSNGALSALSNLSNMFPGSGSPDYYNVQASLASNSLQSQQVGAQIKFNVANLQVTAQNAQIQMDQLQYQSQQLQYSNAVAQQGISTQQYQQAQSDFNFQKYLDTAYYGPIGADTSKNAYYEFMKSQTQAGYNSIAAGQTSLNMNNYQAYGLNNLEFYAGIENQRAMATYGRSPLLNDLGYKQTLKYLDQQEAFYQTSLQLQNQQRAYTYAKDQKELDWQSETLDLNQKSLDMQALLLAQGGKVLDANTAVQKASVSILELQTGWSKEELAVLGLSSKAALQSLNPNTGYNLTPWQIIQQGASAYNTIKDNPNDLKLFQGQINNLNGGNLGASQTMMALIQYLAQNPQLLGDTQDQFIAAVGASKKFNVNDVKSLLTGGAAANDIFAAGTANAAVQTWSDPNQLNNLVNTMVGVEKLFAAMANSLATVNVFLAALASIASKVAPIGIATAGIFSGEALLGKGAGAAIGRGAGALFRSIFGNGIVAATNVPGVAAGEAAAEGVGAVAGADAAVEGAATVAGGIGLGAIGSVAAPVVAGAAAITGGVLVGNTLLKQQGLDPLKVLGDDLGKAGGVITQFFHELFTGKINFGDLVEGLAKAGWQGAVKLGEQLGLGLKRVNWGEFVTDALKDLAGIAKNIIGWFIPTDWKNTIKQWAKDIGDWINQHLPHLDIGMWLGAIGESFAKVGEFFQQIGARATAIFGIFDVSKYFHIDWAWIGQTFAKVGSTIVSLITNPFSTIYSLLKGPANTIVDIINVLIRGLDALSVKVPGWVPGIGGNTWGVNIPQLPHFASGGYMGQSGWAMVGEQGPEMIRLPASSYVYNASQTSQMTSHNQTISLNINVNHQGSVVSHDTVTLDTNTEDKVMSQVLDAIAVALAPALSSTTRPF